MEKLLSGLIDFELQSSSGTTLMRQLYDRLRAAILDGALSPGFRLPSSRDLAHDLKVSRPRTAAAGGGGVDDGAGSRSTSDQPFARHIAPVTLGDAAAQSRVAVRE
jgi:DNA-binding transcriptional MocR family regulator